MVANPNSNLVFDFPDPTPRFEFDDSPTKNKNKPNNNNNTPPNNKKFAGKRFGKFSTKKLTSRGIGVGGGRGEKDDDINELDETNDTSATSLNSSLNSSTTTNNSPQQPSLRRNNSGDKAAGLNFTLADSNNNNSSSTKLNLLPSIGSTSLHKRNPSIASGYVSEVSEFSFDRVTVTTNDTDGMMTGQSSNVSWNFMDETLLGQAGGLQPSAVGGGGGGGFSKNKNNSSSVGCVPYTGGGGSLINGDGAEGNNNKPTPRGASNQATNSQQTKKDVNVVGGGKARRTQSSSTFDNVSLDTEEENELNLQIPFNGEMKMTRPYSDDSVISEISERSSRRTQSHVGEGAVKALLREGMVNAKLRESGMLVDPLPSSESPRSHQQDEEQMNINNNKNDGTTKSTTSSKRSSNNPFLEDIQNNYYKFKTSRNNGLKEGRSILSSIIEDVQFCGLYFCGIDTTITTEEDEAALMMQKKKGGGTYEETLKMKKEGRKKEMEDTFLGKVISCVPKTMCGVDTEEHATAFCGGGR